mgnify:CR=1 FL=1
MIVKDYHEWRQRIEVTRPDRKNALRAAPLYDRIQAQDESSAEAKAVKLLVNHIETDLSELPKRSRLRSRLEKALVIVGKTKAKVLPGQGQPKRSNGGELHRGA